MRNKEMEKYFLPLALLSAVGAFFVRHVAGWRYPDSTQNTDWITHVERFLPSVLCFLAAGLAIASQSEGEFSFLRDVYDLVTTAAAIALGVCGLAYPFQGSVMWIKTVFGISTISLFLTLLFNQYL